MLYDDDDRKVKFSYSLPLQFSGLGFVSLGSFHCALIHLCLSLCILCFCQLHVSYYCNTVRWTWWDWCLMLPSPLLDNIRVMVIVWRLRGNIIRTAACSVLWHNVHSQRHTYMSSTYRSSRLSLSHWDPYAMHRGGCM